RSLNVRVAAVLPDFITALSILVTSNSLLARIPPIHKTGIVDRTPRFQKNSLKFNSLVQLLQMLRGVFIGETEKRV
ncbi:hypothetical protein, partial [Motilimonas pumila]|uniref:hypothetical protein n=1 Tax=Motilimonas pumila TaxID=2303987 RepID=UPI001E2E403C